jgi:peptide/nickel transport system substrate-binding protein
MSREQLTKSVALTAALGLVPALALAGCTQPSSSGSGGKGSGGSQRTVTVALAEQPDALDPTVASTYVGRIVFANMCEKLYDIGSGTSLVPQLASAMPKITNGGKTYTISLRKGVKFNDGTTFDAAAVKQTLQHYMTDPKSARAPELSTVKTVQVVDPSTVRLTLKQAYAPLTAILADRSGMILSPKALSKLGDSFGDHPVCVGPFSFKDRPSADKIDLTKSKYYYDKSKVKLSGITFQAVTQPNVRAANLRSGDVQVVDRVDPADISTLKKQSNVKLWPVTSLGYQGITVNVANSNGAGSPKSHTVSTPLAQHPELRQALSLALDRSTINKVVFEGQYVPACGPISTSSTFAPQVSCPPDMAKAKQLVAGSGVKTPIPVDLIVQAANSEAAKLGTVIQSMAKQAGFAVHVKPTEFTTALTQAQNGQFDTFQVGWSGRLDPDQNIGPFYDPTSTLNYSGANDPTILRLLAQERSTTDESARKAAFQKIVDQANKDNNIIYLYFPKVVLGYASSLHGIQYGADGLIHLKTASFGG